MTRRIFMTADTVGGVWTYALELARALPGIEFAIVAMGTPVTELHREEAAKLRNVTLFPSSHALEWMDDPWNDVDRAGAWLLELAADFKPDVVHLNGYSHATLPWNAPIVVVAHSCVLSWWRAVKKCEAPPRYAEYRRRVSAGLHAADMVVAPTAAMLDSSRINYDFFGEARVVSNGRDARQFTPGPKREIIFGAGRLWDEAKNLEALDAVAPRLPWPIEVAGDSAAPNGRSRELKNLKLSGMMAPAELAQRLATSSIYALPARYEPFGLSVLEAGLCGCALVLGDIASLREVWADAALFVSPEDHDELAGALQELIDDQQLRSAMAARARARAMEFNPVRMTKEYLRIYRDCRAKEGREVPA